MYECPIAVGPRPQVYSDVSDGVTRALDLILGAPCDLTMMKDGLFHGFSPQKILNMMQTCAN